MIDPEIDYKLRSWAQAVAENNLEAAIAAAESRIEIERILIDAFRTESAVREEMWCLLEADGIPPETVSKQQYSMARIKAEAIVEADQKISEMEARLATRKDG